MKKFIYTIAAAAALMSAVSGESFLHEPAQ